MTTVSVMDGIEEGLQLDDRRGRKYTFGKALQKSVLKGITREGEDFIGVKTLEVCGIHRHGKGFDEPWQKGHRARSIRRMKFRGVEMGEGVPNFVFEGADRGLIIQIE